MAWGSFIIGLVVSALLHVWLLMLPAKVAIPKLVVVPVVETELAEVETPPVETEPVVQPSPQDRAATPEPEPQTPEPPLEPLPQPPLVKLADASKSAVEEPGDFAGDADGRNQPQLRINWGTDEQALAALEVGDMVVVVLDAGQRSPRIKQHVTRESGQWRRRPFQPIGGTPYSNRLRIVDHVPAFDEMRRQVGIGDDERLAVLVPTHVARMLESAQLEAAFRHGLAVQHIDNFAGRFTLRRGRLAFDITGVRQAPGSAMP